MKERRPGTPVGLVTGWGDTVDATAAAARGGDFVLAKPVERAHLRAALAGLGGAAGPPTVVAARHIVYSRRRR